MSSRTVVATANVLRTLPRAAARDALRVVLDHDPDLVGLQEWGPSRRGILRSSGPVSLLPGPGGPIGRARTGAAPGRYSWHVAVVGGCAVGVRSDRYDVLRCRLVLLGRAGRSDSPHRRLGIEPPRVAVVATCRDRSVDRLVHLVDVHLAPGSQRSGRYDDRRPLTVAHHQRQLADLARVLAPLLPVGQTCAVGDFNLDGVRLPGLVSAWEGRRDGPGTLGRRQVDDVQAQQPAREVRLVETGSDHRAVLATYES